MTEFAKASLRAQEPPAPTRPITSPDRLPPSRWTGNQSLQRKPGRPDKATNDLFLRLLIQQQLFSDDPIHFAVLLTDNAQAYDPILSKYGYKGIEAWLSGPESSDLAADAKRYFEKAALAWYRAGGARFLNNVSAGEDEYGHFYQGNPRRNALESLQRSARRSVGVAEAIEGANLGLGAIGYGLAGDKGAIIGNIVGTIVGAIGPGVLEGIARRRNATRSGADAASADRYTERDVELSEYRSDEEILAERNEQQQTPAINSEPTPSTKRPVQRNNQQTRVFYNSNRQSNRGATYEISGNSRALEASKKSGFQVYEYVNRNGDLLYVGKSGGVTKPNSNWVQRLQNSHINTDWIAEATTVRVHYGLTEQEMWALEEVLIPESIHKDANVKPGEYSQLFGADGLSANASAAQKSPVASFRINAVPVR